jgi:hypothetical protein
MDKYTFKKVTIDAAGTVSDAADILGFQVVGIATDADWDAQNVTFQVDPTGDGTFCLVAGLTLTAPAASQVTLLNTGAVAPYIIPILLGVSIKVVSAVAQGDATVVTLLLQQLP